MILTCPSCGTKFRIPNDALGDAGRKLRCAACKHVWFEAPARPEPVEPEAPAAIEETPPPPCTPDEPAVQEALPESQDDFNSQAAPDAAPCAPGEQEPQKTPFSVVKPEPEHASEAFAPVATEPDSQESNKTVQASDVGSISEPADPAPPPETQPSAVFTPRDPTGQTPEREQEPEPSEAPDNGKGFSSDTVTPEQQDIETRTEPTFDISRVVAPDSAPAEKPRKKRGGGAKAFLLLLLLIVAVGFGLFEFRNQIMRNIPATIDYYEMAGLVGPPNSLNLEYRDEGSSVEVQGDHTLLIVSGRIVNVGNEFQRLPELRAEILDVTGAVVLDWSFNAAAVGLGPNDQTTYRATYPDPPRGDDLVEILMTFEDVR